MVAAKRFLVPECLVFPPQPASRPTLLAGSFAPAYLLNTLKYGITLSSTLCRSLLLRNTATMCGHSFNFGSLVKRAVNFVVSVHCAA